jgi:hypothetical protein
LARGSSMHRGCEFSIDEWLHNIRKLKGESERVFVLMLFFWGRDNSQLLTTTLEQAALSHGFRLVILSVDLEIDSRWDVSIPRVFDTLMKAVGTTVDVVVGWPPSASVFPVSGDATSEHEAHVLRSPDRLWGSRTLSAAEKLFVCEQNQVFLNFIALCSRTGNGGGGYAFLTPACVYNQSSIDLCNSAEVQELLLRTNGRRVALSTATVPADTVACQWSLVSNMFNKDTEQPFCSLQEFKAQQMCLSEGRSAKLIPDVLVQQLCSTTIGFVLGLRSSGKGPTGHLRPGEARHAASIPLFSTKVSDTCLYGISILNECVVDGRHVRLTPDSGALYLHVDDCIVLGHKHARVSAGTVMNIIADTMEAGGFLVPERFVGNEVRKAVGYKPNLKTGRFTLPDQKQVDLYDALLQCARQSFVDAKVIHALPGVWLHGAQLRRCLISIPFHIFGFVERHIAGWVKLWPSVRAELIQMAFSLPLMTLDLNLRLPQVVSASDAEGSSFSDAGGFGVVASSVTEFEYDCLFKSSEVLGRVLARAGETEGLKKQPEATATHHSIHTIA